MIPLRDSVPSLHVAWVTRILLVLNVLVFALELQQGPRIQAFLYQFGVVPSHWMITSPGDFLNWPKQFLTLFTSQFLHGGFLHLGFNMLYLWVFADNVEDRLGPARFIFLYVGCGVVAALAQIVVTPHSTLPLVGASGAIAGVLGAYLLMFPTARVLTLVPVFFTIRVVELPALVFLGLWFGLQWLQGLTTVGQVADLGGVAFWAHIGGFIGGMIGAVSLHAPKR